MKNTPGLLPLLLLFFLPACQSDAPDERQQENRPELVRSIETAHRKSDFLSHEVVAFDMELNWRGKPTLRANILQRTDGTRICIRKETGTAVLFDGSDSWLAKTLQFDAEARYDLFTWHYFFCLPWKLADPGARWQPLPERVFEKMPCSTGRLTFAPGTGDSSDDWFLVFSDKKDGLLRGAVYVVTYGGKDIEAAEKGPRAIHYSDFRPVDGIPVAHAWKFYGWNTDSLGNKIQLGEAVIRNVRFADEGSEDFSVPAGASKI